MCIEHNLRADNLPATHHLSDYSRTDRVCKEYWP